MKAIILFLLASTLFPNSMTYYYLQNQTNKLQQDNYSINNLKLMQTQFVAPIYPTFTKNFNNGVYSYQVHQQQSAVKRYEYAVDISQYANNNNQFFNYYNSININFSLSFFHHNNYNDTLTKRIQNKSSAYPDNYSYFISQVNSRGANGGWSTNWNDFLAVYSLSFDDDTNTHEGIAWDYRVSGNMFYFYVYIVVVAGGNDKVTSAGAGVNIKSLTFNSSHDVNKLKNNLNSALSKTLDFTSNYSGSLIDHSNIKDPTGQGNDLPTKLNEIIRKQLGNEYDSWANFIQPPSFSDKTREATTLIKFRNPETGQQEVWTFFTPINLRLSSGYWTNIILKRLHIIPGKIVDKNDSTKEMVTDEPETLAPPNIAESYGGKYRYHTSIGMEFDALKQADDGTINPEYVEINGQPVSVLDNKFSATLEDNRITGTNKQHSYRIDIHYKDRTYQEQYTIEIVIETLVPNLQLKWYAWDPNNNPDQAELVKKTLPDGKPNPKYDSEINPSTGTKTQILWVKHKSEVPTPLDPLNKNGEVINPKKNPQDYDLGFIAEGSISGMGVNQVFNDQNITSVYRRAVNASNLLGVASPTDREKNQQIQSDQTGNYWADTGIWHYTVTMADGTTAQKYAIIGVEYQNKYPRFLDTIDNNQAVEFWSTIHGVHLKNYLVDVKKLNTEQMLALNYEQVASYWKEYASDIIAQKVPPDPNPANYYDISGNFPAIKMNEIDTNKIRTLVLSYAQNYINQKVSGAVLGNDYTVVTKEGVDINSNPDTLQSLLDNATSPKYLDIKIKAKPLSSLLIGEAKGSIKNSKNYDPEKVVDLSKIKFKSGKYNFEGYTIEKLKQWIIDNINKGLYPKYSQLVFNQDYGISINKIPPEDDSHNNVPGYFDDIFFKDFLDNTTQTKKITVFLYANNASDLTTGMTSFSLENDVNAIVPPDIPPGPIEPIAPNKPIIPGYNSNDGSDKRYLRWLLPIIIIPIIGIIIGGIWFYFRFKKRIR
ncbi:hypothetical protein M1771_04995 [Spiroplasma citri]|uniref:Uncharacterized protein n=1 Tax=Spiroplasma citri TaxID=2133 RepID=A0AAX3SVW3_SPICI|nr:hypothetical protein [Spiroplasma citri]WFG95460.1 hypothetical protein M0C40_05015 [Spiroplasma citri]WFG99350.1 hypothetical protein M1771_04995 [Spiroplasma citri]